jgi:hypothetical protein
MSLEGASDHAAGRAGTSGAVATFAVPIWRSLPVAADCAAEVYWVARGTYARRAGEQARWLPGIRVPLGHCCQLEAPVTLAEIRASKDAVLELRDQIQAHAGRHAIYFPWNP